MKISELENEALSSDVRCADKINEDLLLKGEFFAREIMAGKVPPDWLMAALSEQLNRLRVDILHACPQNFAANLTPKTVADLEPRVKELGREAKRVRRYIAGKSSHKRKDEQAKSLLRSLQVLGRLVSVEIDGRRAIIGKSASDAASEKIARNGDGVLLNYLFEGLDTPVCLPCDDDQFMLYLNILDEHLRNCSTGDLEASLGLGKDELVACLKFIEELTNNRILVLNEHRQRSREARSVGRGRPPKKSSPPQMRCAAIIKIARQEWPDFVSPADYLCEMFWRAASGKPHDASYGTSRKNDDEVFEAWRSGWCSAASQAPKEIRRDIEYSFLRSR